MFLGYKIPLSYVFLHNDKTTNKNNDKTNIFEPWTDYN
jgi:hypothetical protein